MSLSKKLKKKRPNPKKKATKSQPLLNQRKLRRFLNRPTKLKNWMPQKKIKSKQNQLRITKHPRMMSPKSQQRKQKTIRKSRLRRR